MASNIFLAITITFMYAAPLILTALGGVVSERSGVINIGLEGMMVIGAFAGAAAGYYSASPWIGFLAAGLAGRSAGSAARGGFHHLQGQSDHLGRCPQLHRTGPGSVPLPSVL